MYAEAHSTKAWGGYIIEFVASLLSSFILPCIITCIIYDFTAFIPHTWLSTEILNSVYVGSILASYILTLFLSVAAKLYYVRALYESYIYYIGATAGLDLWDLVVVTIPWLIRTLLILVSLL